MAFWNNRNFKMGELNPMGFDPDDVYLPNGISSIEALNVATQKILERTSTYNDKGLLKAEVIAVYINSEVRPGHFLGFMDRRLAAQGGDPLVRTRAKCRILEAGDALLVKPDMNRAPNGGNILGIDKLFLELHTDYYTPPNSSVDSFPINVGDIVLVDKEGLIHGTLEPGFPGPTKGPDAAPGAKGAFDNSSSAPIPVSPSSYPGIATNDLASLDLETLSRWEALEADLAAHGSSGWTIRETWRSQDRQLFYLEQKWSTVTKSFHMNMTNLGLPASYAIDLSPPNAAVEPSAEQAEQYGLLRDLSSNHGFTSGANWFGIDSPWKQWGVGWDPGHIERNDKSLSEVVVVS
jgi:hypothetical protein